MLETKEVSHKRVSRINIHYSNIPNSWNHFESIISGSPREVWKGGERICSREINYYNTAKGVRETRFKIDISWPPLVFVRYLSEKIIFLTKWYEQINATDNCLAVKNKKQLVPPFKTFLENFFLLLLRVNCQSSFSN